MGLLFKLLGGGVIESVVNGVFGLVQQIGANQITREMIKASVTKAVITAFSEVTEQQANVVLAEIRGEDWLQRNWRPMVALAFAFSYLFVIIMYPFMAAWHILPVVKFGEIGLQNMFELTMVCVGGYIAGRSLEKIAGSIMGKWWK